MRALWFSLGALALIFGVIGIVLPMLPTVPFLLLSAIGFSKSSPRLHDWLLQHPRLGPPIHDWRQNGAIRRRAKIMATICVALTFTISLILALPAHVLGIQAVTLTGVMVFIWTRPEGSR